MSRCKAINPVSLKRCTRGEAHVANGLAHNDGHGTYWATPDIAAMSPDAEFDQRIRDAVTARLARMSDKSPWAVNTMHYELAERAVRVVDTEHRAYRRLNGQN